METVNAGDEAAALLRRLGPAAGSHRRTLDAIFRHPLAHDLEWDDVVGLIGKIGSVEGKHNGELALAVGGAAQVMRRPHGKDLTGADVMALRHFLLRAGAGNGEAGAVAGDLLIVADHHGTRVFGVDVGSDEPSAHLIRPYDPHGFLHHLTHRDQSRERGQRAPEEPAYYERIAQAAAGAGRIVVAGHGTGKSNAADHLVAYLRAHHPETYRRVVREIVADLSGATDHALLVLARDALRHEPGR